MGDGRGIFQSVKEKSGGILCGFRAFLTRIGLEKLRPDPVFSCEYRFLEPVQDLWVFGRERPREQRSRALAKGTRPLGFPSFLGLWGRDFGFCPAGSPCVVDRPPTHFFVKKKFSSIGGAATTTQKVSSVSVTLILSAAQEVPRTQEGAFFFTKKAYCVNQTACVAESRKSVQT